MKNKSIMNRQEQIKMIVIYGVFICYILLLMKVLFLSRVSLQNLFDSQRTFARSVNFIPFRSIMEYISSGSEVVKSFAFGNVIGNIVLFIPLGVYLTLFKKDKRIIVNLLLIFLVSLCVEAIQWLFGIGTADIDDIILNSLGGLLGILGYKLLLAIFRDGKKVSTAIAILSIAGLPVLIYLLFIIKMRF